MSDDSPTPFVNWLVSLRAELAEAEREGRGQDIRLRIDQIELDIEVTTTRDAAAKGGFKLWVVDAGVDGKITAGRKQRLKLSITPLGPDDEVLPVGDDLEERPE